LGRVQDGADVGVLDTAGERDGECRGVPDGCGRRRTVVRLVTWQQSVRALGSFRRVQLRRILEAKHPQLAFLWAEPAFMANVSMATALIDGCEYALNFLGGVPDGVQPRPVTTAGLDVTGSVALRNIR
jgi:hypothetical protein